MELFLLFKLMHHKCPCHPLYLTIIVWNNMDLWSLEMVSVNTGIGISSIFVVVACIGYTINVMA